MHAVCHSPSLDSSQCSPLYRQPVLAPFTHPALSVPDPKSAGIGEQPCPELPEPAGVRASSVWTPVQPPLCDPAHCSITLMAQHSKTWSYQRPGDYFFLMFTDSNVKPSPSAHGKYCQSCGVRKANPYFVNISPINKIWELNAFCA